ncbi:MAG: VCBS repeat-containing protein, partial [Candidatus Marinimicrobia bacterium]|nr:VCBS repeat-containing protein [Candidatus Neomarinimicrobiota bacterium]
MKINRNYFATMIFILIPMLVYGQFWQATGSISGNADAYRIVVDSQDRIFAGVMGVGVFVSADGGTTWTNSGVNGPSIMDLAINNSDHVFAVGNNGVYRTTDNGNTWENVSTGLPSAAVNSIAINNSGRIFVGLYGEKIYRSDDNGSTWERLDSGLSTSTVYVSMAINSSGHIFAGTNGAHVYRSIDNGDNWERLTNGLSEAQVWALEIDSEDRIFAGTGASVFRSTDNGNTWSQQNMGSGSFDINNMTKNSEDHIFATNWHGGVWRSTDHGVSWENLEDPVNGVISWGLGVNLDDYLFCGIGNGQVYRSIESTVAQSGTAPTVITLAETNVTSSGATLNGIVNPNELSTTVTFEWGETMFYGSQVTADQSPLTGTGSTPVNANLTGLTAGTTYHYRVTATNSAGGPVNGTDVSFTTSTIQELFTRVTTGPVVSDGGDSREISWADIDNDGDQDLFIANRNNENNFLYQNEGNGNFTKITNGEVVTDGAFSRAATWGDIDNDGDPDLFVANTSNQTNLLYRNESSGGNLNFIQIGGQPEPNQPASSNGCSWVDYDNDGGLDLFVTNSILDNLLYHNTGGGSLEGIDVGELTHNGAVTISCAWADYNNDGLVDVFLANSNSELNMLFMNTGGGSFTRITSGSIVDESASSRSANWGDYDNDGYQDLFVSNADANNCLYHNNGDGSFTKITTGDLVNEGNSQGAEWADYDNDGWLDLFVVNYGADNYLYHNNGDGSFTKITGNDILINSGGPLVCSWADYDNDGDLDLILTNAGVDNNVLFSNNGNSKHWINILGVGTTSNASAIGAKVRAKATINGSATWQLREITGQSGYLSQASLNAEFGLGDATIIDSIKVEWPSGIVQVLTNVTVDQFLTITEQTPGSAPTTTTEDATGIGATSATLNGTVNPNDLSTTVLFEYGSTTAYGSQLTADQSPVTGTSAVSVSAN